ncbi:phage protease [uncultured Oscillibacter sp.]|uniref:phage protease n=1 Tax=uncultured Oscillibacter sp. TaxID=876091 RepID=UPI0025E467F6|nr:phage protease [uncultured Oscillibacter sp.]
MKDILILKGGSVEVSGVPETITVLPLGRVVSSKGEFNVDEDSLREMKAQIARKGVDLVVDYEHQTLKGVEAPAAGWVKELKLGDGSIVAVVEWTPRGAEYLKNKEYRYLSPVVNVRKTDNKAIGLHSLALTNTPAIENMTPIVNSDNFEGGQKMDMQRLAAALGLGPDATEEQIMEALQAMAAENKSLKEGKQLGDEATVANKAVCELLGLKAGAPAEDVTAKIMELKGGTIDGVNVLEELKVLKQQNAQRDADEAVTLALKAGKITPAQKEWAQSYALTDPKGFGAFVEKAPQVVPMGEIDLGGSVALKFDKPDEATTLVCKQLGVSQEDLDKYRKEE